MLVNRHKVKRNPSKGYEKCKDQRMNAEWVKPLIKEIEPQSIFFIKIKLFVKPF